MVGKNYLNEDFFISLPLVQHWKSKLKVYHFFISYQISIYVKMMIMIWIGLLLVDLSFKNDETLKNSLHGVFDVVSMSNRLNF